jgi:iron-sulfur cluster assembly protein
MKALNITPKAAARIAELVGSNPGTTMRLSVATVGCSGNRYEFALVGNPGPHDERVADNGAEVLLDPKALLVLLGATIDWKEDAFGRQFTFENPNEAGRCGCGASFHLRAQ